MTPTIVGATGNDTIDPYPLPSEGNLTKLLCISKERFEKLKAALDEFGIKPKLASPRPKTFSLQTSARKKPLADTKNDDLKSGRDKRLGHFEPSNIFNLQNSFFWRLRNLKAWFKEQESYEDSRYIKSYSIEI